jgi:NitT/TauT family transport system substrate-binding protein
MSAYLARFLAALLLVALLAACVAPVPGATPIPAAPALAVPTVRVALLGITDVVPFYVAQQEELFTAQGLTAEAVPVSSAAERETVVQSNAADCELTDLHGVILTNATGAEPLRVVATARQAAADQPVFFLMGAPGGKVADASQLAGANIGISENTIIDYWNDRILEALGIDASSITRTSVPQLPVRLELLMAGQLDAAVLPDPLASLARLQGATQLADDTLRPAIAVSVLACRADFIAAQPDAVRAFVAGWDAAVEAINADPDAFGNILIETARVPEPLQDSYSLPPFPAPQVPTPEQVQDVADWALAKGLIQTAPAYDEVVDATFRP